MLFTHSAGRLQKCFLINHAVHPALQDLQICVQSWWHLRQTTRSWQPESAFCFHWTWRLINLDGFQQPERTTPDQLPAPESWSECWPNCHFSTRVSVWTVTLFNLSTWLSATFSQLVFSSEAQRQGKTKRSLLTVEKNKDFLLYRNLLLCVWAEKRQGEYLNNPTFALYFFFLGILHSPHLLWHQQRHIFKHLP